jgi:CheY-like chemotaxis protein
VLDVGLTAMSGIELARMNADGAAVPVIFITGSIRMKCRQSDEDGLRRIPAQTFSRFSAPGRNRKGDPLIIAAAPLGAAQ